MEPKIVGIMTHSRASPMPEMEPIRPTLRSWTASRASVLPSSSMARPAPSRKPATGGVALKYLPAFARDLR